MNESNSLKLAKKSNLTAAIDDDDDADDGICCLLSIDLLTVLVALGSKLPADSFRLRKYSVNSVIVQALTLRMRSLP